MLGTMFTDAVQAFLEKFGYRISRIPSFVRVPESDVAVYKSVRKYTMTTRARILELMEATRYVARFNVPGALVECGVWRGGSVMVILQTLMNLGVTNREIYLYDTFEGMTKPSEQDGTEERNLYQRFSRADGGSDWSRSELDEVRKNVLGCGYPEERIHFLKGKVEDTIPAGAPEQIALLRLDTDWYEPTKHELEHLYPRLAAGGVLILDDYGAWEGCHKATDEYFAKVGRHYLHRIDEAGRILIKHQSSPA
jgi:O-methyltransferase